MKYCSIFVLSFIVGAPTYSAELAPVYDAACIDTIFPSGQHNGFCIGYNSSNRELVLLKTVSTIPTGEERPPGCVDQTLSPGLNSHRRRTVAASFGPQVKIWDLNQSTTNPHIIDTRIDLRTIQLRAPAKKILVASRSMIKLYRIKSNEQLVAHNFDNDVIAYIDASSSLRNITIFLQDGPQHIIQKEESGYGLYQSPLIPPVDIDQDGEKSDSDRKNDPENRDDDNDSSKDYFDDQPGSPDWTSRLRSQSQPVISSSPALQELDDLRTENAQLKHLVRQFERLLQEDRSRIEKFERYKRFFKKQREIDGLRQQLLQAKAHIEQLHQNR